MSKGKAEEARVEMNISKYLEIHGAEYERVVASMLKKKYGGTRRAVSEWVTELSEFRKRKVNF